MRLLLIKSIRPLTILLAGFSLNACAIAKPHTNLCVANAPGNQLKCYWVDKDYGDDGNLKAGAVPNYKPLVTTNDVNKFILTDPDSWAAFKAYVKTVEQELAACNSK